MGDGELRLLLTKIKAGAAKGQDVTEELEKLDHHIWQVRDLVSELSEALDDEDLQIQVNEALGYEEEEEEIEY